MFILILPFIVGISALIAVAYLVYLIGRESSGTEAMTHIAGHIRVGMRAYLSRQSRAILTFIPFLAAVIWLFLGPFFSNVGAAFDNAKKMIENGFLGGKGSMAHKAAIVGDTVGDPFKDVAGPSILIFMKLLGMSALLIAPLLISLQ